jgi:curved DNA-binding protein CbpA
MTNTVVMDGGQAAVARPLKVLVPLIKDDLKAAHDAGLEHYRAAGEKLLEAKVQMEHGEFGPWLKRNFKLSDRQARTYMALAKQNGSALPFSSLGDFQRRTSKPKPEPVKPIEFDGDDDSFSRRMAEAKADREAEKKLAVEMIDAGYRVLAKKYHPDNGGSNEQMAMLTRMRNKIKKTCWWVR